VIGPFAEIMVPPLPCVRSLLLPVLCLLCASLTPAALPLNRARDPFSRDRHVLAELVSVSPGNPGSASISLQWQSFLNSLEPVDVDSVSASALGNVETVAAYEAQFSESGTGRWITLADSITGLGDGLDEESDLHEQQLVFTRADAGESISDGVFRLALAHAGESLLNVEQRTVTPPIPFDASEAQMKVALESLDLVSQVQVFRSPAPADEGGVSAGTGAYRWVIVFDRVVSKSPAGEQENGDLPLLTLYTETISAKWSGAGDQVAVQSLRERQRDHVLCSKECRYRVAALPSGVAYAFRVRARFTTLGWSEWSAASDPLQTPATRKSVRLFLAEILRLTSMMAQWYHRLHRRLS
jgi:hypothetical protein